MFGLSCALLFKVTFAMPQVSVSGPFPNYLPSMTAGSSQNYTFTVTNFANHSWPFSLSGIANAVQRVAIANDCGSSLGPHSTCQFAISISPTAEMSSINQELLVNYGGRDPFSSIIAIQVSGEQVSLNGVTVGYYTNNSNAQVPLSYYTTDFGQTWTVSIPTPAGGAGASQLASVSCGDNARQYCIAAGYFRPGAFNNPLTYITQNGGQTWTSNLPVLQGAGESALNGISCNGEYGQYCTAVGYYSVVGRVALAYYTNNQGSSWVTSSFPAIGTTSSLNGIDCVGSQGQYCVAVGAYFLTAPNNFAHPLAYYSVDAGQTWTAASSLPMVGTGASSLNSVSCNGDHGQYCTAVGSYLASSPIPAHAEPIVYNSVDGGNHWIAVIPPKQGTSNRGSILNSVSCVGNTGEYCMAVGYYPTGIPSSSLAPISYVSTNGGTSWTPFFPPYVGDVGAANSLRGVICQGPQGMQCMAAGVYTSSSVSKPITYYTNDGGENWTYVIPAPQLGASLLLGVD